MTDFKISDLVKIIEDFRKSRGWMENDNPKNVAMGISVEAGELMEHFVWSDISDSWEISKKQEVSDEIADVFIGLISMTNMLDLDIYEIVRNPEVSKYLAWESHKSIIESEEWIKNILQGYDEGNIFSWGIYNKETNSFNINIYRNKKLEKYDMFTFFIDFKKYFDKTLSTFIL